MHLVISPEAKKQLLKLQKSIQKKAQRQFEFLILNYRHPSLRSRKMSGQNVFEARIDYHHRFTFTIEHEEDEHVIYVLTAGPHDEGLGKK